MKNFTIIKYRSLLQAMLDKNFSFLNVQQALSEKQIYSKEKLSVILHDIDRKINKLVTND